MSDHNDRIIARIKGVPAQAGTPESDADPANPNRKIEEAMTHPQAETKLPTDAATLYELLRDVPLPSSNGSPGEFYERFYCWHSKAGNPALWPAWKVPSPATPQPGETKSTTQGE